MPGLGMGILKEAEEVMMPHGFGGMCEAAQGIPYLFNPVHIVDPLTGEKVGACVLTASLSKRNIWLKPSWVRLSQVLSSDMIATMKSLLILWVVCFGAEVPLDFQQVLAYTHELHQTFSSLTHGHMKRRLQISGIPPLPSGCAVCEGIQCWHDDITAVIQGVEESSNDTSAMFSAMTDSFGVHCLHRSSLACATARADCYSLRLGNMTDALQCVCGACPNFPRIYQGFEPLFRLAPRALAGTLSAEEMDELLTHLCPMSSSLECLDARACSRILPPPFENVINELSSMKSLCATANKPTDYTTPWTFTSPTGCAGESVSGAARLLQLKLLAGSFSLLSILN